MPDISDAVREDIEERLGRYLKSKSNYFNPQYVGCGGSAAIYKVETPAGYKAIKVYDPKFLAGRNAKAEARRLVLQQSLIGHDCPTLVAVESVVEAEGTAFIEMEFVAWPQLKEVLAQVPDEKITSLMQQLVAAVTFLDQLEIVHRDIKPENIHVTHDFAKLKLIDLGVVRGLSVPDEEGEDSTDHGHVRPFIATAQYSSPEYLFRLDAPSPALWKALNIYQVGAVLHDMINKKALFQDQVDLGNRWLVARAVLTKVPNFPDADPTRLSAHKALATRCLVKDMNTRLSIVNWSDFAFEADTDPLAALQSRLAKGKGAAGNQSSVANGARLHFERGSFAKKLCDAIRNELIAACDRSVQISLVVLPEGAAEGYSLELAVEKVASLTCEIRFDWFGDIYAESARVRLSGLVRSSPLEVGDAQPNVVTVATLGESYDAIALDVAGRVAQMLTKLLDLIETAVDVGALNGTDMGQLIFHKD